MDAPICQRLLIDARAFDDRPLVEANGSPAKRDLALVGTNADIYHGTVTLDAYLRKGLDPIATADLSWLSSGQPRRWFLSGGSDAHGDFNYRRRGRPATVTGTGGIPRPIPWSERPVSDGGIGKPRNLVLTDAPNGNPIADVPNLRLTTNKQVIGALRSGRFSVTDGPALRIVIDRNRNEIAEDSDFQMGSVVNRYPGEHIPVIVEWKSTPEFGRVKEIQLYVGNKDETFSDANEGPDRIIDYDLSGNTPSIYGRYSKLSDFKFIIPIAKKDAAMAGRVIYYLSAKHFLRSGNTASSLYIRAFAKTVNRQESDPSLQDCKTEFLHDSCGGRQAYSNPIWVLAKPDCTGSQSDPLSIDSNGNAKADACEGVRVEDPCAARGSTLVRGSFLITVFRNTPPVLDSGRPFRFLSTDVSTLNPKLDRSCRVFPLGGGVLVPTGGLSLPITQ